VAQSAIILTERMLTDLSRHASYIQIAGETEACLKEHVLDRWFPQAADEDYGGFNQFFREDWSQEPSTSRSLVYQARLTWVSAKAAKRYPASDGLYRSMALHGLNFLRHNMWDSSSGGLFWALDAAGEQVAWKHTYGIAFAIYAAAATFDLTLDDESLTLACESLSWLEKHAHDPVNGGYYEALRLEGQPFLGPEGAPDLTKYGLRRGRDCIGTLYGLKSMNSHIHLLEAFSELYRVWPKPHLRSRLQEIFEILIERVLHPDGFLHLYFEPNWTVVPSEDSYGHDIETAFLLVEAAEALDIPEDHRTWQAARRIVDHTLRVGWDEQYGGIFREGDPDSGPTTSGQSCKGWWEQAESLNALLLMHERFGGETDRYWTAFLRQWEFITSHQIDKKYKGWYHTLTREGVPPTHARKSDAWTDPYHQARALMNVTDRLRKLAGI